MLDEKLLLGKHTPVVENYAPQLLYPIPRKLGRSSLGLGTELPFHGVDIWHAYEMSWLDSTGKPVVRVGRFSVPAASPNIIESKSFKLYLNSLNNTRFDDDKAAINTIETDLSAVAGGAIELLLFAPNDSALVGETLPGYCLDTLPAGQIYAEPESHILQCQSSGEVEEDVHSHLLRSLCPVTGQPDWATVRVRYKGAPIIRSSLLDYIIAYRQHQEVHEQCVERIYCDIQRRCEPNFLLVQAFYTRRGGLDINPFRSSSADALPLGRLNRQ